MAWESRRKGRKYYYKKRRVGGTVKSEYIGDARMGAYAEQRTEAVRREAEQKSRKWEAIKDEQARLDKMVDDLMEMADAYTSAVMLVTGHHKHTRQWRKIREIRSK